MIASALAAAMLTSTFPAGSKFSFRGHTCNYAVAGTGPQPVLLLHGFAGSGYNSFRETLPALAGETHTVYALDLLGLGASDQPADVTYSIDLWRDQCAAFVDEVLDGTPPVVIGTSFGSLIALELAVSDTPVKALGMANCAVGMNMKGSVKALEVPWQAAIAKVVCGLVDVIFSQKWLLANGLEKFATAETVGNALKEAVYVNPERVTDDLVQDYLSLAKDRDAAVEVVRQIYTNDPGPLPFEASAKLPADYPICIVWGDQDNVASSAGPVGVHFRARAERAEGTKFNDIVGAGHVPHDDAPEKVNPILREWLASL